MVGLPPACRELTVSSPLPPQDWTVRQAAWSVFQLHNETVNVWSHFLGFFAFVGLAWSFAGRYGAEYGPSHKLIVAAHRVGSKMHELEHSAVDAILGQIPPTVARWPLFVFLAGACLCLFLSSVCHLFCCVNEVAPWIWRVDYAGIAALIACSFYPAVYYTFLCQGFWLRVYLGAITLGAVTTLIVSLAPRFGGPTWRVVRAATFSALGSSGIIPITHMFLHYLARGEPMPLPLRHATLLELLMGFLYLLGALLYAKRWPERQYPYVFDYALNSHNLFHFLVVSAALVHVEASLVLLAWRDHSSGCDA